MATLMWKKAENVFVIKSGKCCEKIMKLIDWDNS